ncbi:MAG: sulfotransferase domain-containing protein [Anaerolineae bacterium]|nr:sulfotransferase domain-containing protein [Anaerolineae bacterium]
MTQVRPNFFIIGAPKCGTTAMYQYLNVHPEIYMPTDAKEPHYFAPEYQMPKMQVYRDEAAYLNLFADATTETHIGEASICYLRADAAAQRIQVFAPDAKLIIMLRNPVEMVYSLYYQGLYAGTETLTTFEAALAAEEPRRNGQQIPPRTVPALLQYRSFGYYAAQIQHYLEYFSREQMHIILFDDFKRDTAGAYRDTLRFLGVDETFQPNFEKVNANKIPRMSAINRLTNQPPTWYATTRNILRRTIPQSVRDQFNATLHSINTREVNRPPMQPQTKRQLQDDFREDIDALGDLLGRDLSHWYNQDS